MSRLDDAAVRQARMRLLERMHRRVAHDLRGPLNVLTLNVDLLAVSVEPADERQSRHLDTLRRELNGLQQAFGRWISRLAPWEEETARVDLADVVSEGVALLAGEAKARGVGLTAGSGPSPLSVDARQAALAFTIEAVTWDVLTRLDRGDALQMDATLREQEVVLEWNVTSAEARGPGAIDEVVASLIEVHSGRIEAPDAGPTWARIRLPTAGR